MASARAAVNQNGVPMFTVFQQGAGLVDATAAVQSPAYGCANNGLDIAQDLNDTAHYTGPVMETDNGLLTLRHPVTGDAVNMPGSVWNGDFVWYTIAYNGNCSMLKTGWDRFQPRRRSHVNDLFRMRICGNVYIRYWHLQDRVSYTATDKKNLRTSCCQCGTNRLSSRFGYPFFGDSIHSFTCAASPRRMRAVAPQM